MGRQVSPEKRGYQVGTRVCRGLRPSFRWGARAEPAIVSGHTHQLEQQSPTQPSNIAGRECAASLCKHSGPKAPGGPAPAILASLSTCHRPYECQSLAAATRQRPRPHRPAGAAGSPPATARSCNPLGGPAPCTSLAPTHPTPHTPRACSWQPTPQLTASSTHTSGFGRTFGASRGAAPAQPQGARAGPGRQGPAAARGWQRAPLRPCSGGTGELARSHPGGPGGFGRSHPGGSPGPGHHEGLGGRPGAAWGRCGSGGCPAAAGRLGMGSLPQGGAWRLAPRPLHGRAWASGDAGGACSTQLCMVWGVGGKP